MVGYPSIRDSQNLLISLDLLMIFFLMLWAQGGWKISGKGDRIVDGELTLVLWQGTAETARWLP
jgi:hypothetical protein